MLVAAAAELLSVSMETVGLFYLKHKQYPWSLILLAGHVTIDLLVCACLHPVTFVSISSAGPVVALCISQERITLLQIMGTCMIIGGVIASACLVAQSQEKCCAIPGTLLAIQVSGAAAALVLARTVYKEISPVRGRPYRIALIAFTSFISVLNLTLMEMATHCGMPGLAAVCVLLLALEIACVSQSLRISQLTAHIPIAFACYQIGGVAIQTFMFERQPILLLLAPAGFILLGIHFVIKSAP